MDKFTVAAVAVVLLVIAGLGYLVYWQGQSTFLFKDTLTSVSSDKATLAFAHGWVVVTFPEQTFRLGQCYNVYRVNNGFVNLVPATGCAP